MKNSLEDDLRRVYAKVPGKTRKRTQKMQRRFRRALDEVQILTLADKIEHRLPGFKTDIGLAVAKKLV